MTLNNNFEIYWQNNVSSFLRKVSTTAEVHLADNSKDSIKKASQLSPEESEASPTVTADPRSATFPTCYSFYRNVHLNISTSSLVFSARLLTELSILEVILP